MSLINREKLPMDDELTRLREKVRLQKAELARLNDVLHTKNIELDAMHYVWCDGGCDKGVHRWIDGEITEAHVDIAERQAKRLRAWYRNRVFRKLRGLIASDKSPARDE